MNHPNRVRELHGIDHTKCVPAIRKRNLKHRRPESQERFSDLRLSTLCSNHQRGATD